MNETGRARKDGRGDRGKPAVESKPGLKSHPRVEPRPGPLPKSGPMPRSGQEPGSGSLARPGSHPRPEPSPKPGSSAKSRARPAGRPASSPKAAAGQSVTVDGRRRRGEANLERILTAASALMARQGYQQTSIRDVARESGLSLAAMYYHFEGKEELLYQIQLRTFGSLLEEQERIAGEGGTAEEKLRRLVCNHLSYLTGHARELKVCTFELESLQGEYYRNIERLRRRYFKLIATLIADLMGEGRNGQNGDLNIRHHTLFTFGMLNWVFMWFDSRRDAPTEKLGNKMVDFVLYGFSGPGTRRGR